MVRLFHGLFFASAVTITSFMSLPAYAACGAGDELANIYDLDATFSPTSGELSVRGKMLLVPDAETSSVELLLNKAMKLERFEIADDTVKLAIEDDIEISGQALPRTRRISLIPAHSFGVGDHLEIELQYSGRLTTEDIELGRGAVSPDWTELTFEAAWYPIWLNEPIICSTVDLVLPEGFEVIGPGATIPIGTNRWYLDPGAPVLGRITFAASNSWTVERRQFGPLTIALYSAIPEPRAPQIFGTVEDTYSYYRELFGEPDGSEQSMTLLLPNGQVALKQPNQSYSTNGDFIAMDQSDPIVQLDALNHEIAHLWWSAGKPGTQDEFVSESISEYLAMRRGGQIWGEDWLRQRRASAAARAEEIPSSLRDIDGPGGDRQSLLYDRGPTALWALHERIGEEAMDALLLSVRASEIDTLEGFLTKAEIEHPGSARLLNEKL
ncbi:hypothetical protein K3175_12030 [Qipengyuania sp. GH1]|uniref:hypothetical protein n=1 Tax=Qipengyuania aestuarii TaxID=2867241 RepID=UPI001C87C6F0|nr:hypothetical protein [Qipengyuania aestuarii]MBX7536386.1 hypothetical protein [Qipengyuania aestuarii]